MDIKPVYPTPPPAPLHKVEVHEDTRRGKPGKQGPHEQRPARPDEADGGPHVDAYV